MKPATSSPATTTGRTRTSGTLSMAAAILTLLLGLLVFAVAKEMFGSVVLSLRFRCLCLRRTFCPLRRGDDRCGIQLLSAGDGLCVLPVCEGANRGAPGAHRVGSGIGVGHQAFRNSDSSDPVGARAMRSLSRRGRFRRRRSWVMSCGGCSGPKNRVRLFRRHSMRPRPPEFQSGWLPGLKKVALEVR